MTHEFSKKQFLILFHAGEMRLAVPSFFVHEILHFLPTVKKNDASFIEYRGRLVPAIDRGKLFSLPPLEPRLSSRWILLTDQKELYALLGERVTKGVYAENIEGAEAIKIGEELIPLLDVGKVFSEKRRDVHEI